ncbi:dNA replication protein dnaD [Clostridium sp. CAG:628]|jgi:DNA replication protein|nr:dNA replication protein dnaD [Clostridium sp. CAG:628]
MNDIKKEFLKKDFIINTNIVKTISNLDITIKEFMLLLYFININNSLDLKNIKDKIGLNDEDILNTYSSLLTKKLISVSLVKTNGLSSEEINLDMFYDKLIMNTKTEEVSTDIYSKFESEFGRVLSPIEYETINRWLSSGVKEDLILSALKEAVVSGACNLRYIDKIIYSWTKKGKSEEKEDYQELFDYDWLGDESEE